MNSRLGSFKLTAWFKLRQVTIVSLYWRIVPVAFSSTEGLFFHIKSQLSSYTGVETRSLRATSIRGLLSICCHRFLSRSIPLYSPWPTTLNQPTACLGCWCVFLLCSIYFNFHWRIVKRFTSNAEYAMLLVHVPMIKKDTPRSLLFICCVCYVYFI